MRVHAEPADRGGLHQPRPATRADGVDPHAPARWCCPARACWSRTSWCTSRTDGSSTSRPRRRAIEAVRGPAGRDEGARSLGEVSLVEGSSRVRAAGVTFHDTLFDENAGCHVAWGQGFPFALQRRPVESGRRAASRAAQLLDRAHRRGHRRAGRRRRRHHGGRHRRPAHPRGRLGAARGLSDDDGPAP